MIALLTRLAARLLALFRGRELDLDFEEELGSHLSMIIEDNIRRGMSPEDARREALIHMGSWTSLQEQHRRTRGLPALEAVARDFRDARRNLRRFPVVGAVAILSLSFGIGGVTATVTFMKAVILSPPPLYREPKDLLRVSVIRPDRRGSEAVPSPLYDRFSARQGLFSGIGGAAEIRSRNARLERHEAPMPVQAITPSLPSVLGVSPVMGRVFTSQDAEPGAAPVALLSYRTWQRDLHGNPDVLGTIVRLDGVAHTIVGVMPQRFYFESTRTAVWTPLTTRSLGSFTAPALSIILRASDTSPGILESAFAEDITEYRKALLISEPMMQPRVRHIYATSVSDAMDLTRSFVAAGAVFLTLIAVSLTLAITCANVGVVMIAQWTARQPEMAIRAVLGAGRWRIVRTLIFESLIVSSCAGVVAVAATATFRGFVISFVPDSVFYDFSIDTSILATVAALALVSGLVSGILPALSETRTLELRPAQFIRRRVSTRFRGALVIAEITLVIALLVLTGAMVNSYYRIMSAGGGFNLDHLVTLQVESETAVHLDDIIQRIRILPEVQNAAAGSAAPLFSMTPDQKVLPAPDAESVSSVVSYVGSGYFGTLGMPLIRGREFSQPEDIRDSSVVIVNETIARRFWPGLDPIGLHIWINGGSTEVVGIAADFVSAFMVTAPPTVFFPLSQRATKVTSQQFLVRTTGEPTHVIPALRSEIAAISGDQTVARVDTVKNAIKQGAEENLVGVVIFLPLVFVGLVLSAAGMYGILTFTISRQMRELAVRMAVGATSRDVLWLVAGQTSRLVVTGITVGTVLMFWLVRIAQHRNYIFREPGTLMFFVPVFILLVTAAVASWVPARRAISLDPATTLRSDG